MRAREAPNAWAARSPFPPCPVAAPRPHRSAAPGPLGRPRVTQKRHSDHAEACPAYTRKRLTVSRGLPGVLPKAAPGLPRGRLGCAKGGEGLPGLEASARPCGHLLFLPYRPGPPSAQPEPTPCPTIGRPEPTMGNPEAAPGLPQGRPRRHARRAWHPCNSCNVGRPHGPHSAICEAASRAIPLVYILNSCMEGLQKRPICKGAGLAQMQKYMADFNALAFFSFETLARVQGRP